MLVWLRVVVELFIVLKVLVELCVFYFFKIVVISKHEQKQRSADSMLEVLVCSVHCATVTAPE